MIKTGVKATYIPNSWSRNNVIYDQFIITDNSVPILNVPTLINNGTLNLYINSLHDFDNISEVVKKNDKFELVESTENYNIDHVTLHPNKNGIDSYYVRIRGPQKTVIFEIEIAKLGVSNLITLLYRIDGYC